MAWPSCRKSDPLMRWRHGTWSDAPFHRIVSPFPRNRRFGNTASLVITQVPSNGLGRLGPKRGCLGHTAATGPHITFLKRNELFFIVKMALFSSISRHDLRNTILNKVPIENSEKRGFLGPIQSNGTGIVRAGHHAPLEIRPKHESKLFDAE